MTKSTNIGAGTPGLKLTDLPAPEHQARVSTGQVEVKPLLNPDGYVFPNAPESYRGRWVDQDQDGYPTSSVRVLSELGNNAPDFLWPASPTPPLVTLDHCRGLDNSAHVNLGWWGRLEEVAQNYLLQQQMAGMAKFVDNLAQPGNLAMFSGVEKATVKRSDFVADPKTVGFAGTPTGGELKRVDVEISARLGAVSASFWTESKDGQVVNGGWLGKVPEELAWFGLAKADPSYFGARFDLL